MSIRTVLVVVLALVFGVSAVLGVNMLRNRPAASVAAPPTAPSEEPPPPAPLPPAVVKEETVTVVVATADIERFTPVTAAMLKTRDYPKSFAPPGAIGRIEDAIDRDAKTLINKDEPILENRLAARGEGRGLAALIPPGMRASTILTPSLASGVAGLIKPGNKVDVLFTHKTTAKDTDTGGASTTTLLQDVEILAVDHRIDPATANVPDLKEMRSVTLLVTPSQAAKLDLAQNLGTLHLSLRNPKDKEAARTPVATANGLKFFQDKPWDRQLKDLWDGVVKLMPERMPEKPAKPADKGEPLVVGPVPRELSPPAPPPPPLIIRTYHGTDPGIIPVLPPKQ